MKFKIWLLVLAICLNLAGCSVPRYETIVIAEHGACLKSLNLSTGEVNLSEKMVNELNCLGLDEGYSGWDAMICEDEGTVFYISQQGIIKSNGADDDYLLVNETDIGGMLINKSWLYYCCHPLRLTFA